jgi:putative aldouronate transport system substrate-binding protein
MGNTASDAIFYNPLRALPKDIGAFVTVYSFGHDNIRTIGNLTDNPDFWLTPVNNPVLNPGDTTKTGYTAVMNGPTIGITAACEDIELAARWIDQLFTYEYMVLQTYGVEGVTFYIDENGKYNWDELIANHPDGPALASTIYLPSTSALGWYNWLPDTQGDTFGWEILGIRDQFGLDSSELTIPERITLIGDDVVRFETLKTTIETIAFESFINFITGARSMDEWDTFVNSLYSAGVEEAIAIQQAALDRYYSRGYD